MYRSVVTSNDLQEMCGRSLQKIVRPKILSQISDPIAILV